MKILTYTLLILLFIGCAKDTRTTIDYTVLDDLGNPVNGTVVGLFKTYNDAYNLTNQLGSSYSTNSSGKVYFETDQSGQLLVLARNELTCSDNLGNGIITTITAGVNNTGSLIISTTGDIQFQNKSSNSYRVYIDGKAVQDVPGKSNYKHRFIQTGNRTIRVLQLEGYILFPTDLTSTEAIVKCGSTPVSFP